MLPFVAISDVANRCPSYPKTLMQYFFWKITGLKKSGKLFCDLRHSVVGTTIVWRFWNLLSAVQTPVTGLFKSIPPAKVFKVVVGSVAVKVSSFLTISGRPDKCFKNYSVNVSPTTSTKGNRKVAIQAENWLKSSYPSFSETKNFSRFGYGIFFVCAIYVANIS